MATDLRQRGGPEAIRPWLSAGRGHVVITSRNPGWNELASRTEITPFARYESAALLHARVSGLSELDADELAEELGDLPLALAHAAGTLTETGLSVAEYRDLLSQRANEVLDENPPSTYPVSLAATVRVSMERLTELAPAAVSVLQICAMLAPEPIPTGWLANADTFPEPTMAAEVADPLALGRVVRRIGQFGLARIGSSGLRLHRMSKAVIRDQMSAAERLTLHGRAEALLIAAHPGSPDDPRPGRSGHNCCRTSLSWTRRTVTTASYAVWRAMPRCIYCAAAIQPRQCRSCNVSTISGGYASVPMTETP